MSRIEKASQFKTDQNVSVKFKGQIRNATVLKTQADKVKVEIFDMTGKSLKSDWFESSDVSPFVKN
jgi:predicted lipase